MPPGAQGYDRYAYVGNNPVNNIDPSGHFGNLDAEKSDYWNRQNQGRVNALEEKWEKERALREMQSRLGRFGGGKPFSSMLPGGTPPPPPTPFPTLPPVSPCQAGQTCYDSNPPYGYYIAGYRTYYEWSDLDWLDVGVNGLGIAGSGALLFGGVGVISAPVGIAAYEATQLIGIGYDVYKVNMGNLSVDATLQLLSQFKEIGRLAPAVGTVINFLNISQDVQNVKRTAPIYEPYLPPIIVP